MHDKAICVPHNTFHAKPIGTPLKRSDLIPGSFATQGVRQNWRYCKHTLLFLTQTHHVTNEQEHAERAPTISFNTGIYVVSCTPFAYGDGSAILSSHPW